MFAQIDKVDPSYLHQFMLVVVVLVSMAVNVVTLVRGGRIQRREVSFTEGMVTKDQCGLKHVGIEQRVATVEKDIHELRTWQAEQMEKLRREIKTDISTLHGRINDVLSAVAEVRGEIRRINTGNVGRP